MKTLTSVLKNPANQATPIPQFVIYPESKSQSKVGKMNFKYDLMKPWKGYIMDNQNFCMQGQ